MVQSHPRLQFLPMPSELGEVLGTLAMGRAGQGGLHGGVGRTVDRAHEMSGALHARLGPCPALRSLPYLEQLLLQLFYLNGLLLRPFLPTPAPQLSQRQSLLALLLYHHCLHMLVCSHIPSPACCCPPMVLPSNGAALQWC